MTVDMLMYGFKFFVARLNAIVVSSDKKIAKEKKAITRKKNMIVKHDIEKRRAREAAKKMNEFLV